MIHLLNCYKKIYGLHKFSIENSSKFHTFFGDFTPFFHTFLQKDFHHIIRLLRRYKNIYFQHRFFIENSSKLVISHLFFTPFSKNAFALHFSSVIRNFQKKSRPLPITILKFCIVTRFVTTDGRTTHDAAQDHNTLSGQRPSG